MAVRQAEVHKIGDPVVRPRGERENNDRVVRRNIGWGFRSLDSGVGHREACNCDWEADHQGDHSLG